MLGLRATYRTLHVVQDGIDMKKLLAKHILKYSNYYIDVSCTSCDINILEYVERTNNCVYATASRKSAARGVNPHRERKQGTIYRCQKCYDTLFGGVSLR